MPFTMKSTLWKKKEKYSDAEFDALKYLFEFFA